ncbi:MAG: hypothetical protein HW414_281 [Dehalococcoidia bacterium]|nr:hypothetical protein [Dehalococcoidia bacterium]
MSLGPLLALLGSFFFALNNLASRRAVLRVKDTSAGAAVSVFISLPVLFLALVVTGNVGDIFRFPWHGYLWLLGAGIIHQYTGRSLNFVSVKLVGANISGVLRRSSPLVAVGLGVFVLGEVLTGKALAGILLIVAGVVLVGWNPWQTGKSKTSFGNMSLKGILTGVGAGVCYGISPMMIKMAYSGLSSPIAAAFISFVGAAAVYAFLHARGDKRELLVTMDSRTFWWFTIAGLLVVFAQLARFFALSMAPISVISPLFDVNPIMIVGLSYIFNRKLEVFSKSVIFSTVIVVAGSFLLLS